MKIIPLYSQLLLRGLYSVLGLGKFVYDQSESDN